MKGSVRANPLQCDVMGREGHKWGTEGGQIEREWNESQEGYK